MKFKVEKDTKLFADLTGLFERINFCQQKAKELVKASGFTVYCTDSTAWMGGGITGFSSKTQPDGYKNIGLHLWFPKANLKNNKALLKAIEELPKVLSNDANEILHFKRQVIGSRFISRPSISCCKNYCLVSVSSDCKYEPLPDMTEILESEYKRLYEAMDKENEIVNDQSDAATGAG